MDPTVAMAMMMAACMAAQMGVVARGRVTVGADTYAYAYQPQSGTYELSGHGRVLRTRPNRDGTLGLDVVSGPQVRNLGFRSLAVRGGALVKLS